MGDATSARTPAASGARAAINRKAAAVGAGIGALQKMRAPKPPSRLGRTLGGIGKTKRW
jgi:hypothetical protein